MLALRTGRKLRKAAVAATVYCRPSNPVRKMKVQLALGMTIGLGALGVYVLHAQVKPPIYYIAEVDVIDLDGYMKEFVPKAATTAEAYSGRTLAAGQKVTAIEGTQPKNRVVLMRWTAWSSFEPGGIPHSIRKIARSLINMQLRCGRLPLRACPKSKAARLSIFG